MQVVMKEPHFRAKEAGTVVGVRPCVKETVSFRLYDTTLQVSTTANPSAGGERAPDWKTFNRLLRVLRGKGFTVGRDPWFNKFPSQAKFHRLVSTSTPHGELYATCEAGQNGCTIEFFQEVNHDNRNGGRFDFDKRKKMPYLIRKKFEGALKSMTSDLIARGFILDQKIDTATCALAVAHRLNVVEGKAAPLSASDLSAAALTFFNDKWDGVYERSRGTHRFHRDASGWPSERELTSYGSGNRDRDGHLIGHGETRLFRDRRGYIARGRVYGGINGMWMTVYGPGEHDVTHLSSKELFSGDPRLMPRRLKKPKSLTVALAEAVERQDFERAIVLRDLIARNELVSKAA